MKKLTIIVLFYTSLTGCASHKPPMPTGKWTAVNEVGFVPPNAVLYTKKLPEPKQIDVVEVDLQPTDKQNGGKE